MQLSRIIHGYRIGGFIYQLSLTHPLTPSIKFCLLSHFSSKPLFNIFPYCLKTNLHRFSERSCQDLSMEEKIQFLTKLRRNKKSIA